ncbi:hypothetical protein K474DRAFT_1677996 [Panus rudis PR-1116 ss-1]|nr:hypothetical protein K474DRAFT_1677996 [Panus rudis PR-1116 ss-1]
MSHRSHPTAFRISFGEGTAASGTTSLREREKQRAEPEQALSAQQGTHLGGSVSSPSIADLARELEYDPGEFDGIGSSQPVYSRYNATHKMENGKGYYDTNDIEYSSPGPQRYPSNTHVFSSQRRQLIFQDQYPNNPFYAEEDLYEHENHKPQYAAEKSHTNYQYMQQLQPRRHYISRVDVHPNDDSNESSAVGYQDLPVYSNQERTRIQPPRTNLAQQIRPHSYRPQAGPPRGWGQQNPEPSACQGSTKRETNSREIRLKPVSGLPDMYGGMFKFGGFNSVQPQYYDEVISGTFLSPSRDSSLEPFLSALPGSGKTVLFVNRDVANERPSPRKLSNGKYEYILWCLLLFSYLPPPRCQHRCKDKATCRHLCCRDGLPKPSPVPKSRKMSQLQSQSQLTSFKAAKQDHENQVRSIRAKTSARHLSKKSAPKDDRRLKELEQSQSKTRVSERLHLPEGRRLKLKDDKSLSSSSPPSVPCRLGRSATMNGTEQRLAKFDCKNGNLALGENEMPFKQLPKSADSTLQEIPGTPSDTDSAEYDDPGFYELLVAAGVLTQSDSVTETQMKSSPTPHTVSRRLKLEDDKSLSSSSPPSVPRRLGHSAIMNGTEQRFAKFDCKNGNLALGENEMPFKQLPKSADSTLQEIPGTPSDTDSAEYDDPGFYELLVAAGVLTQSDSVTETQMTSSPTPRTASNSNDNWSSSPVIHSTTSSSPPTAREGTWSASPVTDLTTPSSPTSDTPRKRARSSELDSTSSPLLRKHAKLTSELPSTRMGSNMRLV